MEDYRKNWGECLRMIREKVADDHAYDVWFSGIVMDGYDAERNELVLRVPSRYVYEYLEMYCVKLLSQVLSANFKPGVRLSYRVEKEAAVQAQQGFEVNVDSQRVSVPNARKRLEDGLRHFLGDEYKWLPEYDKVAGWLTDNKGRGLLLVGAPGLGKTLLCTKILPVILGRKVPVVSAQEMNSRIDELLKEKCVIIDDLGKEPVEIRNYGNRRTPFFELCDAAEKNGSVLIITTNLATTPKPQGWSGPYPYPTSIEERYGQAVSSRLRAIIRVVLLEGEDMRH